MALFNCGRTVCAVLVLIIATFGSIRSADLRTVAATQWWQKAGFYQIYPRSFMDSNGDGIGDLNGITSRLPYLKSIGVKAFWLSPIYASPMADFGYDISDFRAIQPEYGTMNDFTAMVDKARELGLKLILDFVPNHSSDEHEWFVKSENRETGYEDYYVWHDGKPGSNPDQNDPPNNWVEAFRGSAWKWSDKRKQYYLHQFHYKQPDLNYRNPKVVEEMKNVLRFWLKLGVDGFRCDAVPNLFEDADFKDELPSGNSDDPLRPEYLIHTYTQDLPETVEMVYQWRQVVEEYSNVSQKILMTEAWSDLSIIKTYFEDANGRQGSHIPFNFQLIMRLNETSDAAQFKTVIDSWLDTVPKNHTPNYVIGNHDKRRVASRMGGEHMVDIMELVELSLPGVSITYQGEEIGMIDFEPTWTETKDPAACQTTPEVYQLYSRDPARTPFQWDDTKNAGFTTGDTTWLPVGSTYRRINAAVQQNVSASHLGIFKTLMELRDKPDFHNCQYTTALAGESTFAILRVLPEQVYVTLVNIGSVQDVVDLKSTLNVVGRSYPNWQIIISSVSSKRTRGDSISGDSVVLQPYEGLVLQSNAAKLMGTLLTLVVVLFANFLARKVY